MDSETKLSHEVISAKKRAISSIGKENKTFIYKGNFLYVLKVLNLKMN